MNSDGSSIDGTVTQMFRRNLQIETSSTRTGQHQNVGNENDQNSMNNPQEVRVQGQGRAVIKRTTAKTTVASTLARPRTTVSSSVSQPYRVYEAAEYYRRKKELHLKQIKEEEERQRKHVAKPMPNFKAIHEKVLAAKRDSAETCVSPETPEVLRRGLAMKEKQKQKIMEFQSKLAERPPIVKRSVKVLNKEVFQPKLPSHPPIKVVPFHLSMSDRLKERKQWDENYQSELAKKKEMEQKKLAEEEARNRQLLRDQTVFKAQPNPFKKYEVVSEEA
ncbi:hypothetical protein Bhyg_12866 [Pseudolycoriella hygida]|uniref:TPX2 C-terminal domain-containing protein n=1 Tax=Pseudolycoriella hygida TaxID=35572 RepID=A0A9Q0MY78_9DIPT|nr:hypothetical protein Bhyg_12866 [Pseudolycoriella hygida]